MGNWRQIFWKRHTIVFTLCTQELLKCTKTWSLITSGLVWKKDIADYVTRCLTCQQVKAKHQVPSGLLQPIIILEWKWDQVTMDFISGLPLTQEKHDAIWVIMDRLTKSAHFLPVRTDYSLEKVAKLYISEIVRLHWIPISIIFDRDPMFTSRF